MRNIFVNYKRIYFVLFLIVFLSLTFNICYADSSSSIGTFSDNSSGPVVLDYFPKGMIRQPNAMFQITTDKKATCKYSKYPNMTYEFMEGAFNYNYETLHKTELLNLNDGVFRVYIRCIDDSEKKGEEKEASFSINLPVSAEIALSKDSPLREGRVEITVSASKFLSGEPALSYSLDSSTYSKIPLTGEGKVWRGYIVIPISTGEVVGSFKFSGTDLEGYSGQEITSGAIFNVDTIRPDIVVNIDAQGYEGSIKLTWNYQGDADKFNIYKSNSPSVDYNDFLKSVNDEYFNDNSVEKGKTYYYKVSAVDDAGNEADLSREVSATALLKNSTPSLGLGLELIGSVDNMLTEIDSFIGDAEDAKSGLDKKPEKEKMLFSELQLDKEISDSISEMNALKREVDKYKLQDLTKEELNNKLDSTRLKLNVLKKKIPENLIILEEKQFSNTFNDQDIESSILELNSAISESNKDKSLQKTKEAIKTGLKINSSAYIIEIVYLDGTKNDISLIKKEISFNGEEGLVFLEIVPKAIAEQSSEISIKNSDYEIVKSDPIISFPSTTQKIVYSLDKKISLTDAEGIKLVPVIISEENVSSAGITGYFSLAVPENKTYIGIGVGVFVVLLLFFYLFYIKRKKPSEKFSEISKKISEAENLLNEKKIKEAEAVYNSVKGDYKILEKKEKDKIYLDIMGLRDKIRFYYLEDGIEKLKLEKEKGNSIIFPSEFEEIYNELPENLKQKIASSFEKTRQEVK